MKNKSNSVCSSPISELNSSVQLHWNVFTGYLCKKHISWHVCHDNIVGGFTAVVSLRRSDSGKGSWKHYIQLYCHCACNKVQWQPAQEKPPSELVSSFSWAPGLKVLVLVFLDTECWTGCPACFHFDLLIIRPTCRCCQDDFSRSAGCVTAEEEEWRAKS